MKAFRASPWCGRGVLTSAIMSPAWNASPVCSARRIAVALARSPRSGAVAVVQDQPQALVFQQQTGMLQDEGFKRLSRVDDARMRRRRLHPAVSTPVLQAMHAGGSRHRALGDAVHVHDRPNH